MESIIKASVLFFIAFTLPTNELNLKGPVCDSMQQEAPQSPKPAAAKDSFWLTNIFLFES